MTFYGFIVLIHVVAAVVGLGPAFIFPLFIKLSKTREHLVLINGMLEKAEKSIKIGSIMLLLTGLILGFLNPQLFTEIWYIASILLYLVAQIFVIGVGAKNTKKVLTLLEQTEESDISIEVNALNKKIINTHYIVSIIAIVMISIMNIKPDI